jgi:hypothetical protein
LQSKLLIFLNIFKEIKETSHIGKFPKVLSGHLCGYPRHQYITDCKYTKKNNPIILSELFIFLDMFQNKPRFTGFNRYGFCNGGGTSIMQ